MRSEAHELYFDMTFVHANLCQHTFTTRSLGWGGAGGGGGVYLKCSPVAAIFFVVVLAKCVERF